MAKPFGGHFLLRAVDFDFCDEMIKPLTDIAANSVSKVDSVSVDRLNRLGRIGAICNRSEIPENFGRYSLVVPIKCTATQPRCTGFPSFLIRCSRASHDRRP